MDMDKIDIVLFRYKVERTLSKKFKKMRWLMVIPIIMFFFIGCASFFISKRDIGGEILILCIMFMLIWEKIAKGKWGTRTWKEKRMKIYQEKFKLDQSKRIEIIKEEGMNCQQVYNLLIKRHNRMPQREDKRTFIITIFSLVIAFTGILASPLQNNNLVNYVQYVEYVIVILLFLIPLGYIVYEIIDVQSTQYDKKKNTYEYIIKLLEDVLF